MAAAPRRGQQSTAALPGGRWRAYARAPVARTTAPNISRPARWGPLLLALFGVGLLPMVLSAPLDWLTGNGHLVEISLLVGVGAIAYPYLARRFGGTQPASLRWLLLFSGALVVLVLTTGIFGGSTDEPFTTTRYAGLILAGKNPYTTQLVFNYTQCSGPTQGALVACASYTSRSYFVYLPLLPFLAIPLIPYQVTTSLCWVAALYLVRNRPWALLVIGSPYPALLAANGYNDFPGVLLLVLAFVTLTGPPRKIAEWVALGTKQFANLFVAGYYLWRRDIRNFAVTVGVSVLWLLPFLLVGPKAVVCTAGLHRNPDCSGGSTLDVLTHVNYWFWALLVLALFPVVVPKLLAAGRGVRQKLLHR
ncbi:MAG: hypothetical protein L3K04_02530 [Thermoplasmata archaeon]|nr:hypothetical protein [Thermoplasmata archaeon]